MIRASGVAIAIAIAVIGACSSPYSGDAPATGDAGDEAATLDAGSSGTDAYVDASALCHGACPPHHACTAVDGSPVCGGCVDAYGDAGDGGCAFVDPIQDPTFGGTLSGGWMLAGGATLEAAPSGTSPMDPGVAMFAAPCKPDGEIRQAFVLPSLDEAEPLAFDVSTGIFDLGSGSLYMAVSGRRFDIPVPHGTASFLATRLCVGERFYGTTTGVELRDSCVHGGGEFLDHLSMAPEPTCPRPGTLTNGDFEEPDGWVLAGGAAIVDGKGTNGSRASHLSFAGCGTATVTGNVSLASATPSPALSMFVRATAGTRLAILMGATSIGEVVGTDAAEAVHLCLPEWGRGLAWNLELAYEASHTCSGTMPAGDAYVDDLAIVTDPACAADGHLFDGGFEMASSASSWVRFEQPPLTGAARTTGDAHGGAAFMRLTSSPSGSECATSATSQTVTVPDPVPGAGGPAARFWYRTAGSATTLGSHAVNEYLLPASTWTQKTECLTPTDVGTHTLIEFSVTGSGNCTGVTMDVDDVAIVHDKTCPE